MDSANFDQSLKTKCKIDNVCNKETNEITTEINENEKALQKTADKYSAF